LTVTNLLIVAAGIGFLLTIMFLLWHERDNPVYEDSS